MTPRPTDESFATSGKNVLHEVKLQFIQPGKLVQNCFVESFNGRFRDECLNENWFVSLNDARRIIAKWKDDYNEIWARGSLNGRTPSEFARQWSLRADTPSSILPLKGEEEKRPINNSAERTL